jgi:hypothetical protein
MRGVSGEAQSGFQGQITNSQVRIAMRPYMGCGRTTPLLLFIAKRITQNRNPQLNFCGGRIFDSKLTIRNSKLPFRLPTFTPSGIPAFPPI